MTPLKTYQYRVGVLHGTANWSTIEADAFGFGQTNTLKFFREGEVIAVIKDWAEIREMSMVTA